jgi:ABC-type bacteriocin/lantibiotic exporter with double-glycine peptidase domain
MIVTILSAVLVCYDALAVIQFESDVPVSADIGIDHSQAEFERVPSRRQDCGAKSLYIICRLAGRPRTIGDLRQMTNTTDTGTTLLGLKKAAESIGFRAESCQLSYDDLVEHLARRGAYAVLHSHKNHFVAVVNAGEEGLVVLDPGIGVDTASEAVLSSNRYRWSHVALLLEDPGDHKVTGM